MGARTTDPLMFHAEVVRRDDKPVGYVRAASYGFSNALLAMTPRIDDSIERLGLTSEVFAPEPVATADAGDAPESIHLAREGMSLRLRRRDEARTAPLVPASST